MKTTDFFVVYPIKEYIQADNNFIETKHQSYPINKAYDILNEDKGYHFRVNKNGTYIFFGDLDYYRKNFKTFSIVLISFLEKNYNLMVKPEDIKFTKNKFK